eukprot:3180358-Prymnesium_polylepis.1
MADILSVGPPPPLLGAPCTKGRARRASDGAHQSWGSHRLRLRTPEAPQSAAVAVRARPPMGLRRPRTSKTEISDASSQA